MSTTELELQLFNFVTERKEIPKWTSTFADFAGIRWVTARRFLAAKEEENNGEPLTVEWVNENWQTKNPPKPSTTEADNNNNASAGAGTAADDDTKADETVVEAEAAVVRRSLSAMSSEDQNRFFDAVDTMKVNKGGPGSSEFFRLASYHGEPTPIYCHHGRETFPGWHRIYMFEFEKALIAADKANGNDGNIGLPYYDWSSDAVIDAGLPDIIRKRFAEWPENFWPSDLKPRFPLTRSSNAYIARYIRAWDANTSAYSCLRATQHYAHASTGGELSTYPSIESPHNSMHVIIGGQGGTMSSVAWAAYDICFWLHHCNVDRIYESYLALETDSAEEFENYQDMQRVDLFEQDFKPFINPDTGKYYSATHTFSTLNLQYRYDSLLQPRPLQLREAPTLCVLPNVQVSTFASKCYQVHVFIIDETKEDEWKEPATEDEIDVESANYAGGEGVFGRGMECENCLARKPYNLVIDITKTLRDLGVSRYKAKAKVYALEVTSDSPNLIPRAQTPLPEPIITGPLFEDPDTSLDQANREANNTFEVQALQRFLQKFGYYGTESAVDGDYGPVTEQAVLDYQNATGMQASGVLDAATKKSIVDLKRCSNLDPFAKNDVRDAASDGVSYGGRKALTYFIGTHPGYMKRADVEKAVDSAVAMWSEACGLTFTQIENAHSGKDADIRFTWTRGEFSDNPLAFDGVGGVLGHGGTDANGENGFVQFDIAERWICGLNDGDDAKLSALSDTTTWYRGQPLISLFYTAVHEMGHALGLDHSMKMEDIMSPFYDPKLKKLSKNDVSRIQAIHGASANANDNSDQN